MPENINEANLLFGLYLDYQYSLANYLKSEGDILLGFHDLFKKGEYVTEKGMRYVFIR